MGMGGGGSTGGAMSDINVTPLIDVLLVLLIIFMVIVPVTPKGWRRWFRSRRRTRRRSSRTIARSWCRCSRTEQLRRRTRSTRPAFAKADIEPKLAEIFATRQEKVMFVKGDKDLDFGKVAEVIDFGHQAGRGQHRSHYAAGWKQDAVRPEQ